MTGRIDLTREPVDLADAMRQLRLVRAVLEVICSHADTLLGLRPLDADHTAMQAAWMEARAVAMDALDKTRAAGGVA